MRAIQIVTTRLSSCLRPIRFELVSSSSSPRLLSNSRRLICTAAATKSNGGRSGSIVAPLVENEEVQKIDVNPPKGTRDFAPEDMRLRNWLFDHFKEVYSNLQRFEFFIPSIEIWTYTIDLKVSRLFGYEEVDYPVLETEALFIRKAGEEIRDQVGSFMPQCCSFSIF